MDRIAYFSMLHAEEAANKAKKQMNLTVSISNSKQILHNPVSEPHKASSTSHVQADAESCPSSTKLAIHQSAAEKRKAYQNGAHASSM